MTLFLEQLGRREREIMNAVFASGNRASAEEIRARLKNPPSSSSVRVMLTRLEKKGFVRHTEDGLRYVYSATVTPARAMTSAFQEYLRTFCAGSLSQMVAALVRDGSWSDSQLNELDEAIARARQKKR